MVQAINLRSEPPAILINFNQHLRQIHPFTHTLGQGQPQSPRAGRQFRLAPGQLLLQDSMNKIQDTPHLVDGVPPNLRPARITLRHPRPLQVNPLLHIPLQRPQALPVQGVHLLRGKTRNVPDLFRNLQQLGLHLKGADLPGLALPVEGLGMAHQFSLALRKVAVDVRIVPLRGGANPLHGIGKTAGELSAGLETTVTVHDQIGKTGPLQPVDHHLNGSLLLGNEQNPLGVGDQRRYQVGNGLRLAGARRAPDDLRLAGQGPVDGLMLAGVSV